MTKAWKFLAVLAIIGLVIADVLLRPWEWVRSWAL